MFVVALGIVVVVVVAKWLVISLSGDVLALAACRPKDNVTGVKNDERTW